MGRPFLDVESGNVPFAHLVSSQQSNALALGKAVTSEHAPPQVSAQNRGANLGHQAGLHVARGTVVTDKGSIATSFT